MKYSHLIVGTVGIVIGLFAGQLLRRPGTGSGSETPVANRPTLTGITQKVAPAQMSDGDKNRPVGKRLLSGDHLSQPAADEATITAYLERHGHSKDALVAAALLSSNPAYLREAAERYPDDPNIQLLVIGSDAFSEDRSEWIERFKKSQPDNAVAALLLGGDLLARGDVENGLAELRLAAGQTTHNDFAAEGALAMQSALIEFGIPPLEMKLRTLPVHAIRHLQQLQAGAKSLQTLAENATSPEEKTELATLGVALGNHMTQGEANRAGINRLVGYSIESQFLNMLDPDLDSPSFPESPAAMLREVEADTAQLKADLNLDERIPDLSEQQVIHLIDRIHAVGQPEAWIWLREQLGEAGAGERPE